MQRRERGDDDRRAPLEGDCDHDEVVGEIDIFTSATGNYDIITLAHLKKMKNNAIAGNIGHFDNVIDMAGLEGFPASRWRTSSPRWMLRLS